MRPREGDEDDEADSAMQSIEEALGARLKLADAMAVEDEAAALACARVAEAAASEDRETADLRRPVVCDAAVSCASRAMWLLRCIAAALRTEELGVDTTSLTERARIDQQSAVLRASQVVATAVTAPGLFGTRTASDDLFFGTGGAMPWGRCGAVW